MNEVILVTGAGRGIGRVISDLLTRRGYIAVRGDILSVDAWEPSLADDRSSRRFLDVTSRRSCSEYVDAVFNEFGRIDGLVNNAGVVTRGPAETVSEHEFERVMDVNLKGTLRMSQSVFPVLSKAGGGRIVNIGSTNGHVAVRDTLGYCISKAGVMHMARVLAFEWARHGIRVNSVAPTIVPTDMTADVRSDTSYMDQKMSSIPLGQMATPEDVAEGVAFFISDKAKMVTGQTLFVDGGVTLA